MLAAGGSNNSEPTNTYVLQKLTLALGLASGGSTAPEQTYLRYLLSAIRDPAMGAEGFFRAPSSRRVSESGICPVTAALLGP